jgi:hypothetical protein
MTASSSVVGRPSKPVVTASSEEESGFLLVGFLLCVKRYASKPRNQAYWSDSLLRVSRSPILLFGETSSGSGSILLEAAVLSHPPVVSQSHYEPLRAHVEEPSGAKQVRQIPILEVLGPSWLTEEPEYFRPSLAV